MVELNASTDNPLVFDNGDVISGGNFHGQPVAQALDILAMTLTTLQAIAERRVERLVNPDLSQGLPAFLTEDPGLSSGLMMVQITAASLVAESRALAMPASIGSFRPMQTRKTSCRWAWPPPSRPDAFSPMPSGWSRPSCSAPRRVWSSCGPLAPGGGLRPCIDGIRSLTPPVLPLGPDRPPAPDLERLARAVAHGELDPGERGERRRP